MTKEQADKIIALLVDIREQVARTANATARDNSFVFYGAIPTDGHSETPTVR